MGQEEKERVQISVIIPVYNVKKYIEECLNSLVGQSFKAFEVICVDDCSNDGTSEVIQEYEKEYSNIHVIRNRENSGAAISRNNGLKYAKGKYVIFLDSDDLFHEQLLESMFWVCEEKHADAAFCNFETFSDSNDRKCKYQWSEDLLKEGGIIDGDRNRGLLFECPVFFPCNKLVLKELLINSQIEFQNIPNCNDVFYSMMIYSMAERIVLLDKTFVFYRENREGNISQNREQKKNYIIWAFAHYICEMKKRGMWKGVLLQAGVKLILDQSYYLAVNSKEVIATRIVDDFRELLMPQLEKSGLLHTKWSIYQYQYLSGAVTMPKSKYNIYFEEIAQYLKAREEKKIGLWGAGKWGNQFIDAIGENKDFIEYVIDNDIQKQGTLWNGFVICSFDSVKDDIDEVLVLNSRFIRDVKKQVDGECCVMDFKRVLIEKENIYIEGILN